MITEKQNLNSFFLGVILVISSILIGLFGFMLIEKYSFLEALYMTAITISTVGYTTIRPLSNDGMLFVSFYLLFNIAILTFTISMITNYIFEGKLQKIYRNYLVKKKINRMLDHIIVCGLGRNGSKAFEDLTLAGEICIAIEKDKNTIQKRKGILSNSHFINQDAILDDTLVKANIKSAKAIIISLPNDADNVFITLTARQLNPNITIISRASEETTDIKLKRAGADFVVMPDYIGGSHMAQLIIKPDLIRFTDILSGMGANHLKLEEIHYEYLNPDFKNNKLYLLKNIGNHDIIHIGFKNKSGEFIINPNSELLFEKGATLIILGKASSILDFKMKCCQTK